MDLTPLTAMKQERSRCGGVAYAVVAVAIMIGVFQPSRASAQAAPPTACDSAASFAFDGQRVAPGVSYDAINAPVAIAECTQGVRLYPTSGRLHFELGRAFEKAGNIPRAIAAYNRAAQLAHGGGFNNLGELYRAGKGVPHNLGIARQEFEAGSALGYPEAEFNLANLLLRQAPTDANTERARQLLTSALNAGYTDASGALQRLPAPVASAPASASATESVPAVARATGPSFDCSKIGRDALSTIICSSPQLSVQNLLLGQTYYALRHQVGAFGHDALKAEAKASNTAMKQRCAVPSTPPLPLSAQSYVACIQSETDRIRGTWMSRLTNEDLEEAKRPVEQLIAAQQELIRQGLLSNATVADGIFGDATRKALSSWQAANGLPAIGSLDDKTATLLLHVPGSTAFSVTQAMAATGNGPDTPDTGQQPSLASSGALQPTRRLATIPWSAFNQSQQNNSSTSTPSHDATEVDTKIATGVTQTKNRDDELKAEEPAPITLAPQTTQNDNLARSTSNHDASSDESVTPRPANTEQETAQPVPAYETFKFWGIIGSGILLLSALAYVGKHFIGVRTASDEMENLELWSADEDQVGNRVRAWLTSGPLSYESASVFEIKGIRHFLVPFGSCTVQWTADWSGNVGQVDRGSLNNAMNVYAMAKSHYDLIPEKVRHRHARPEQPSESNHILWSYGGNKVSGTINYHCLNCADVTGINGIPSEFRAWSTEITRDLKKTHRLGDGSSFAISDISAPTSNWSPRLQIKPHAIPSADSEDIKATLSQEVKKQAEKAVRKDLPKYHSNIGHVYQFSIENWHYWLVPIFLVAYKSPKGDHVCIVDGLTGRLFHGSKVLDIGGALRRRVTALKNIFKRPQPKLLAPPLKALPAPDIQDAKEEVGEDV
jgi:TPR repeat protein